MIKVNRLIVQILLIFLTISNSCRADLDPIQVKVGDMVKYPGLLFYVGKAAEVKQKLLDGEQYKELSDSYNNIITLLKSNQSYEEQRVAALVKDNDQIATALYNERSHSDMQKMTFFGLGVVVSIIGVY